MKSRFKIIIGLLFLILLTGCVVKEIVNQEETKVAPVEEEDGPIDWKSEYFVSFPLKIIKDSITFYNSDTVKFHGQSSISFINGTVSLIDTNIVILPNTQGKLVDVSKDATGKINVMKVLFEKNSKYPVPFVWSTVDQVYSIQKAIPKSKLLWYLNRAETTLILSGYENLKD